MFLSPKKLFKCLLLTVLFLESKKLRKRGTAASKFSDVIKFLTLPLASFPKYKTSTSPSFSNFIEVAILDDCPK